MDLKDFQRDTVKRVLSAFANGSRRYLVADEVGLGKTRIARHVLQGMLHPGRNLQVFYICSSLSIINQNRTSLLEALPPGQRSQASVPVDRLTLLPTVSESADVPLTLYTLTPGTLPGANRTGRADERATIWRLLCVAIPHLARFSTLELAFRRNVGSWDDDLEEAQTSLDARPAKRDGLADAFRRKLALLLGLSESCWSSTLIQRLRKESEKDNGRELVSRCRIALSQAALASLAPDVIIIDEFQNFFELLVPDEEDEDKDYVARTLVDQLLVGNGSKDPSLLLLSATPYKLYSGWRDGSSNHHEQFFKLVEFLFGKKGPVQVKELRDQFTAYRTALLSDPVGSRQIIAIKSDIEATLTKVMTRTERPAATVLGRKATFYMPEAPLDEIDVGVFRHLGDAVSCSRDRSSIVGYWGSIPYPAQTMDEQYVFTKRARPAPFRGGMKEAAITPGQVRRFAPISHPHPKLRALLKITPPAQLALPWMLPTKEWWPSAGVFQNAAATSDARMSKTLIFSRFRAVPRSLSATLSYEAERECFAIPRQKERSGKCVPYEYRTEKDGTRSGALRVRPRPSFTFPRVSKQDTALRSLLMFLPVPALARLGEPLCLAAANQDLHRTTVQTEIERSIAAKFDTVTSGARTQPLWPWVARLASLSECAKLTPHIVQDLARKTLSSDEDPGDAKRSGIENALGALRSTTRAPGNPDRRVISELAELALLAPGNVLYRAVERIFGPRQSTRENQRRRDAIAAVSLGPLRTYLDLPDFHLLFKTRQLSQHPTAIRRAVWDGNLEAVLDEHLAVLAGLAKPQLDIDAEELALKKLGASLDVGVASVTFWEIDSKRNRHAFRIRCHAALPFGLGNQQKEDGDGEIRSDGLRTSFNSPFRPHVLTTTSVGQEGLDFHVWAKRIVHWDLPSNPIDLEQREGRIDRFGSLAVRHAIASSGAPLPATSSPWRSIAAAQPELERGLSPWWTHPDSRIDRIVLAPTFSKIVDDLERLQEALALYRLTLGQVDQDALLQALRRRFDKDNSEALMRWLQKARIDLSPRECPSPTP